MFDDILKKWGGREVSAMDVYSDIFDLGDGVIQRDEQESHTLKSNPLGYWKNHDHVKGHYRIFFEETFEQTLKELQEADFAIINGLSYFGRKNLQANANRMHALIFDLDDVNDEKLNNFLSGAFVAEAYPVPNYIALSGHGVHLYYVLEEPVPLYPNIKVQLKALKYALTDKMWNSYTSTNEKKQFQGINQGFRPIGGKTKIPGVRVRAFKVNDHPFTLRALGEYVLEEFQVDEEQLYKETRLTLAEAKRRYPEWYQKRVVQGDKVRGRWTTKRDLYDWWKRRIRRGAGYHHRYFCIMCLAIYAVKAGIEEEELRKDAYDYIPFMTALYPVEPFTSSDVESALECYDERYCRFPIEDLSRLSAIPIQRNKRNGRPQKVHLMMTRSIQQIGDQVNGTNWRDGNGRPQKGDQVREWRRLHPEGRKVDCIRDTGLSRPTVKKYWDT